MHGSMHVGRKWVVGENGYDYVGGYGCQEVNSLFNNLTSCLSS